MIRQHGHHVSDGEARGVHVVEHAVVLRNPGDDRISQLGDDSEALQPGRPLSGERFRSGIDDHPSFACTHHGGRDPGGAAVLPLGVQRDLLTVPEHVCPRALFGDDGWAGSTPGGCRPRAHHRDGETRVIQCACRVFQVIALVGPGGVRCIGARVRVATVGEDTGDAQTHSPALLGERRRVRRPHPGPVLPAVDLDQHRDIRAPGRLGDGRGTRGTLDPDTQPDTLGEFAESPRLGADRQHRVGDEDVVDPVTGECLRFRDRRDGDADCARRHLELGDLDALVRFGMRPQIDRLGACTLGHRRHVGLQPPEIDHQGRCFDIQRSRQHRRHSSRVLTRRAAVLGTGRPAPRRSRPDSRRRPGPNRRRDAAAGFRHRS
ncbi:hypothetical protein MYFR107205_05485 [Mycolicibacterium frederiksbergense]